MPRIRALRHARSRAAALALRRRWRRARRRHAARPRRPNRRRAAPRQLDAEKLFGAIVKVSTRAVPNARSAATLGKEREGTGVVIGDDGLIAHDRLPDRRGRRGEDHRQQGPRAARAGRRLRPCDRLRPRAQRSCRSTRRRSPLGDSAQLAERDPVMIASHAGDDDVDVRVDRRRSARSPATGNTCSTRRSSRARRRSTGAARR